MHRLWIAMPNPSGQHPPGYLSEDRPGVRNRPADVDEPDRKGEVDMSNGFGYGGWYGGMDDEGGQGNTEPGAYRGDLAGEQPLRGPHAGKGPHGFERADARLRGQICEALEDDGWVDASNIQIAVVRAEVTLAGTVDDRLMRQRAED
ncbi:MAG TPA: BON domain-containing protein, partial [Kofleriaceae bacterium]|nr:BON domain-containing protein [Kofleriaceae bacterium]